jgi:hypothetical protein
MASKKKKSAPRKAAKKSGGAPGIKLTTERVTLNRQGYDRSGGYWGTGEKLWRVVVVDRSTDIYNDTHVRAPNAREAKAATIAAMLKSLSLKPEQREAVRRKHGGDPHDPHARVMPAGHRISASQGPETERYAHEPMNLEGMDDEALRRVSVSSKADPRLRELAVVFGRARKARLAGMIDSAMEYEERAQAMYDVLPTHLRW